MIDNVVVLKSNYRIDPWQFDDLIHINESPAEISEMLCGNSQFGVRHANAA